MIDTPKTAAQLREEIQSLLEQQEHNALSNNFAYTDGSNRRLETQINRAKTDLHKAEARERGAH